MTPDQLAAEMAAALANARPQIRLSQLEPVQAVARGVFALIEERLAEPYSGLPNFLTREEIGIQVLAECLGTWQAESMEAMIDKWLARESGYCPVVTFSRVGVGIQCALSKSVNQCWFGQAATPGEALGEALIEFDSEGTPDA